MARGLLNLPRRLATSLADTARWLAANPGPLLAAMAALVVGAALGAPVGNRGYDYMWRDAQFCDDCHVHDYANDAYAHSVHAGVTTCHDCHRVSLRHYPKNLYRALLDRPTGPDDIPKPDVETLICTQCHSAETAKEPLTGPLPESMRASIVKIDQSRLHRVHLESRLRTPATAQGGSEPEHEAPAVATGGHPPERAPWDAGVIACVDCHASGTDRVHKFEAISENCLGCHGEIELPEGRLGRVACRECHFAGFSGEGTEVAAGPSPHAPSAPKP